ncbi:hypothetical protein T01_13086 [Trichinella spiralis]|uniref:Uncharacterized protein n=1 Tax=Trichinella spiralis TaxID=6334 RepID=A0A0V1B7K0_TRISP|nr:hypothetical protein T01_13086 [Trichinella spiralis]
MSELSLTIITSIVYPFCTTFQFLLHKSSLKNFLDWRNVRELLDWISLGYLHQESAGNCALSFPETAPARAILFIWTTPLTYAAISTYQKLLETAVTDRVHYILHNTVAIPNGEQARQKKMGLSKGTCSRSDPKDATSPADTSPRRPAAGRDSVMLAKSQQDSHQVGLEVPRGGRALMFLPLTRPSRTNLIRNFHGCVLLGWQVLLIDNSLVRTRLNEPKCCGQALHCEQTTF